MDRIVIEAAIHYGERRIKPVFGYDDQVIRIVKKIPGSAWSRTMRCWHIPYEPDVVKKLLDHFKGIAWLGDSPLKKKADIRDAPTAIANLVPAPEKDHATTGELKR